MPFQRWNLQSRLIVAAGVFCLGYWFIFSSRSRIPWRKDAGLEYVLSDDSLRSIENSTLGFQKLFVINMPARTDRRDAVDLAAATTNLKFDFIPGVGGDSIPEAALPPEGSRESIKMLKGIRGSWRSHMNALNEIVHQNLTTAVIFEDDMDWDIRLRPQLRAFALASQFLTSPSVTPSSLTNYPISQSENPEDPDLSIHNDSSLNPTSSFLNSLPLSATSGSIKKEERYPYGDPKNWDILWLGHCGVGFPRSPSSSGSEEVPSPENLVLTNHPDLTVPLPKYLRAHPFGPLDALGSSHPPHTRVYHHASGGALCTVAYAVSQRGARRLLAEFGVKRWSRIWDDELGQWCAGSDFPPSPPSFSSSPEIQNQEEKRRKLGERKCITSQPPIFAHHHPPGGESNIGGLGGGYARTVESKYLRLSVRMNLWALIRGEGIEGLVDQWPDIERD
ncbi:hypothetical protein BGZ60DRAFT_389973 [Tricladium varicosporioides]|nr:hypothetical protein BGZ60DRAFT_389973 [Hymenoscyphus varicosporioides]